MLRHFKLKRNICILTALSMVLLFSAGCGGNDAAGSAEEARSEAESGAAIEADQEAAGDDSSETGSEDKAAEAGSGDTGLAADSEAAGQDPAGGEDLSESNNSGTDSTGTSTNGADSAATSDSAGEQKISEEAASETVPTLKPGMIFNTQTNELGKLVGGQPGDQTKKEARIEAYPSFYRADSYPWDYILHCTNEDLRLEAVRLACAGAANDMLGYDSGDLKNTFWDEVQAVDYDPALVENPCSANCATSILTFYRCAAIRLGIEEVMDIDCTENVWMMEEVLLETGLFEKITEHDRLHSPDRNMAGDIYTAESRHTIMQVSDGKDVEDN